MNSSSIQTFVEASTIQRNAGCSEETLREFVARSGWRLPADHVELLKNSDGTTAYGGYFRLFGVGSSKALCDLESWNADAEWKFAWPLRVREFLCFGETGWGDQYAYRLDNLDGRLDPAVYFLEAVTLKPEQIATSFDRFLLDEFLRNAREPYDKMLVQARRRLGDIAPNEHIAHVPSLLISGQENIEDVVKMNAIGAMIANGDLASQLAGQLQSRKTEGVEPYVDEKGRMRLRVLWR